MNKKPIIIYIVLIIVILTTVFFSQQSRSKDIVKNFSNFIGKYAGASLSGAIKLNPFSSSASNSATNSSASNNNPTTAANTASSTKLTNSAYSATGAKTAPTIDVLVNNKETILVPSVTEKTTEPEKTTISEKVTETLKSGGEAISNTVNVAKENISSAEKNISNYFSEITTSIIKPGTPQNCPAVPTP